MYISFNSFQYANNGMFRETDKRIHIKHNIQPVETHGVRLYGLRFQYLAETGKEIFCLVHREAERRQQADRIRSRHTGENLLLK